jgi:hypothetical protein
MTLSRCAGSRFAHSSRAEPCKFMPKFRIKDGPGKGSELCGVHLRTWGFLPNHKDVERIPKDEWGKDEN